MSDSHGLIGTFFKKFAVALLVEVAALVAFVAILVAWVSLDLPFSGFHFAVLGVVVLALAGVGMRTARRRSRD